MMNICRNCGKKFLSLKGVYCSHTCYEEFANRKHGHTSWHDRLMCGNCEVMVSEILNLWKEKHDNKGPNAA